MTVTGVEDMLQNINKLQGNGEKYGREAVRKGAETFEKIIEKNTAKNEGELARSVDKTGIRGAGKGGLEIAVGYNQKHGWRAHFPNDGTVYQRPQHFKEESVEEARGPVQQIFVEKLKGVMDL